MFSFNCIIYRQVEVAWMPTLWHCIFLPYLHNDVVQGFLKEAFRTAHKIQRCCVLLIADGVELPGFGEKG